MGVLGVPVTRGEAASSGEGPSCGVALDADGEQQLGEEASCGAFPAMAGSAGVTSTVGCRGLSGVQGGICGVLGNLLGVVLGKLGDF